MSVENQFAFGFERAHESLPGQGQIQTRYLRGFNAVVHSLGADPRHVLERHDIDPAIFMDPDNHVDCMSVAKMLEYCGSRLDDPSFGLRLAQSQGPDVFGPVAALARAAPTFRDGLQVLIDYLPVFHSPEGNVDVVEASKVVEIRCIACGELNAFQQPKLQGFALIWKTLQMLGGSYCRPVYLRYESEMSRQSIEILRDWAGCKLLGSNVNAIALPSDILDRPIATSNNLVFELLGSYLSHVRNGPKPSFETQMEAYVRGALRSGSCAIDHCATRLGMTKRTLQKRLARLGTTFSDIVESHRAAMAKKALREDRHTLDGIAMSLGYSDQTCFGRAFKRWTGITPQAYRDQFTC